MKELAAALAQCFRDEQGARSFLTEMGYPVDRLQPFGSARQFWAEVVSELELGILADGIPTIVVAAAEWYPGHAVLQELAAKQAAVDEARDAPAGRSAEPPVEEDGDCFAILAINTTQHAEFLDVVRSVADPDAELLYATRQISAVRIQDPGASAGQVAARIEEELAARQISADVSYANYAFRPYLLASLVVYGPDGAPYELRGVPASTPVRDIPFAVLNHYDDEAVRNRRGQFMETTVDLVDEDGTPHRLDPNRSLHENGVTDGASMRVGARATAGSGVGQTMEWFDRARAQIDLFAQRHEEFTVTKTDDPDLPTLFEIEIRSPGFAPPPEAGAEPVLIDRHRLRIMLTREFPRRAPAVQWRSEVFHPNIVPAWRGDVPKGAVCLGPLMDAYRPDLDFAVLCQLLVDMAGYRNYEARTLGRWEETEGYVNIPAATWARSEHGQERILAIGGIPLPPPDDDPGGAAGRPIPLWVEPWGAGE
ncbi:hypothetical protein DMA12_21110 [Amycolatopsis balhimycina DSM 5908]|uniref:Uncharacterized protein n=1 Tax=Amycolatopsis balhimycina DSM 5908 TaxID=1081091 RepID=A0A428WI15_AMYBA|nr:effector-associated domain EAD1-containing protein [Amycolatopsis balhimycina]RSM42721.1 hypothetical protein DMA12_21110 [Amycolatopsis balhimycina DSM 5908]